MLIPNFVTTKETDIAITRKYLAKNDIDLIEYNFADYVPDKTFVDIWLSNQLAQFLGYKGIVSSFSDLNSNISKPVVFIIDLVNNKNICQVYNHSFFIRHLIYLPNGAISEIKDRKFGFVILASEEILDQSVKRNLGQFQTLYQNYIKQLKVEDDNDLKTWAKEYARNPTLNPSSTKRQALALKIHAYLADGEWATSTAIADCLKANLRSVRLILVNVRDAWGYETDNYKGYRRRQ